MIGNNLLTTISSRDKYPWKDFKKAVVSLHDEQGDLARNNSIWNAYVEEMQSMGHCDAVFSRGASYIATSPASITLLPDSDTDHILCGRRGMIDTVIEGLTEAITGLELDPDEVLHVEPQVRPIGGGLTLQLPDRILLQADRDNVEAIANGMGIHYERTPVAWTIVNQEGISLDAICNNLDEGERRETDLYRVDKERYLVDEMKFERYEDEAPPVVDELRRYRHPHTQRFDHCYWRDGGCIRLTDVDWRYAYWDLMNEPFIMFDPEQNILLTPAFNGRAPNLIRRALVLCSGRPSQICWANRHAMDPFIPALRRIHLEEYRDVPGIIAEHVAQLLGRNDGPILCRFRRILE